MLIPKTARSRRADFIPAVESYELCFLAGELGPPERKALRQIVEDADLLEAAGGVWLLARVTSETIDAMCNFESDGEDREPDLCDEPCDLEPDVDDEPDHRTPVCAYENPLKGEIA